MLPTQQALLHASLPLFREQGETIVGLFYEDIFLSHPHLKRRFSMQDQVSGLQAERFTRAVVAYVESLGPEATQPLWVLTVSRTHLRHNVGRQHFDIFRVHFLRAIQRVLGETATPELVDAWAAAYDEMSAMMMAAQAAPHSA
jgi:nitric oxide dioxygenase